jgi:hypothetical protein
VRVILAPGLALLRQTASSNSSRHGCKSRPRSNDGYSAVSVFLLALLLSSNNTCTRKPKITHRCKVHKIHHNSPQFTTIHPLKPTKFTDWNKRRWRRTHTTHMNLHMVRLLGDHGSTTQARIQSSSPSPGFRA